jgi:hypothetical protein
MMLSVKCFKLAFLNCSLKILVFGTGTGTKYQHFSKVESGSGSGTTTLVLKMFSLQLTGFTTFALSCWRRAATSRLHIG